MKQYKFIVRDLNNKFWGIFPVRNMSWDESGHLWVISIDFMDNNNSNDFLPFYNYTGEFISVHGNLKGKIIE